MWLNIGVYNITRRNINVQTDQGPTLKNAINQINLKHWLWPYSMLPSTHWALTNLIFFFIFTARDHMTHQQICQSSWIQQKLKCFTWDFENKPNEIFVINCLVFLTLTYTSLSFFSILPIVIKRSHLIGHGFQNNRLRLCWFPWLILKLCKWKTGNKQGCRFIS